MTESLLYLAVGVGLLINLLSVDFLGLILGGFVVPGYLALQVTKAGHMAYLFLVALATVVIVKTLSKFMIIYGRKLLVMSVLVGYLINWSVYTLTAAWGSEGQGIHFGLIIPGLLAYWMQRQGVFATAALSLTGAVVIRLLLVVVTGGVVPL